MALSVVFEVHEADYHYDETEEKKIWMMVRCRGDLAKDLQDFEIFEVSDYKGKNRSKKHMDDALVPVINKDNLEKVEGSVFGRSYFHECETELYDSNLSVPSMALLEQITTIDKMRLKKYIGRINEEELSYIDKALAISVGLESL